MSIRHSFNQHPEAIASIQRASKSPPAPWTRVYIAAKMAEAVAMRTGEIGDRLGKLGLLNLDNIRNSINAARAKAEAKSVWADAEDAREELAVLSSTFASIRVGLGIMNKYESFYGIALSIAETGTAYIRSTSDAPDTPLSAKVSFIANPYRANPLVAIDTAASLAYHAAGFLEEAGQPLSMLPPPYNLPRMYIETIHGHGFRAMDLQECFQDKMMQAVVSLRVLNHNTHELFTRKPIRDLLQNRVDLHTLLATTQYLADSFTPPSKNQRVEHEKTLRPAADVIDFHTRRPR